MSLDDDSPRAMEVEVLKSMYEEHELRFPYPDNKYTFILTVTIELASTRRIPFDLTCTLPVGYPLEPMSMSVGCSEAGRSTCEVVKEGIVKSFEGVGEDAMRVLTAVDWLRDHAEDFEYHDAVESSSGRSETESTGEADESSSNPDTKVSFCIFHHLLEGKAHKKEKDLVSEAKARGICGLLVYGTPGVVVTDAMTVDVAVFLSTCNSTIGKKGRLAMEISIPKTVVDEVFGLKASKLRVVELQTVKQLLEAAGAGDMYTKMLRVD